MTLHIKPISLALGIGLLAPALSLAQESRIVTPDNFRRAESHLFFSNTVKRGGFGQFRHLREPMPVSSQTVVRPNRDTLYSPAVFDLDAGPVTITLPDAGKRFMSMLIIDEDHYARDAIYGAGRYTITRESSNTRYVLAGIRTLVDPNSAEDLKAVHALQDAIKVEQKSPGSFEIPRWDTVSQGKVRSALLALGQTIPDTIRMFGQKEQVDPVRHLVGTAMAWGGNSEKDAFYLNVTPEKNDGKTVYRLTVKDVPVDGFWSVSLYNAEGYLQKNPLDAYTFNNLTAKKDADGATTIQFGACTAQIPNCLPVMENWNYMVRFFRPRASLLDGSWKFPQAVEVR